MEEEKGPIVIKLLSVFWRVIFFGFLILAGGIFYLRSFVNWSFLFIVLILLFYYLIMIYKTSFIFYDDKLEFISLFSKFSCSYDQISKITFRRKSLINRSNVLEIEDKNGFSTQYSIFPFGLWNIAIYEERIKRLLEKKSITVSFNKMYWGWWS